MALLAKGQPQPLRTLSRTSSFSAATSSSTSSSKYDNPIMVTSRNLQCMPSDDEDDLEDIEDDEEEENDDDDDDKLLLSQAIKHPFFSVETDFPKNYKRRSDGAGMNNKLMTMEEDSQQRKDKAQLRHSIGFPIQTPIQHQPQPQRQHLTTSASYPNNQNNNDHNNTKAGMMMMIPPPLLSVESTSSPSPATTNAQSNTFQHAPLPSPSGAPSNALSQQYLRHRASLSGVDLIMAREQYEQQKVKNKNHPLNQKKWDSTHAPIGGLLARLPQQGQHTISFQQQQLQQMQLQRLKQQQQQQQQQMMFYQQQQQQQQQMYQQYYYYHPVQRNMNASMFLPSSIPRSPTSHLPRW